VAIDPIGAAVLGIGGSLFGGLLGGSGKQTTTAEYPDWYRNAIITALANQLDASSLGPPLYTGAATAAMAPQQMAAMGNTNDMAGALGLNSAPSFGNYLPQAQTFDGGIRGHSSAGMVQQALGALPEEVQMAHRGLYGPHGSRARMAQSLIAGTDLELPSAYSSGSGYDPFSAGRNFGFG
jgi:hypothetical protein